MDLRLWGRFCNFQAERCNFDKQQRSIVHNTPIQKGTADYGHGPQGDVRRVYNYVRFVRDI